MIALLADIHGNREALSACLADAARRKADRHVFLGDLVGYGAEPGWVVDLVRDYAERGAVVIRGNHDDAAAGAAVSMNETATAAIDWTRRQLTSAQRDFLSELPLSAQDANRLYVHASADEPAQWHYILDTNAARRSFAATPAQQTFCGHVHQPTLYYLSAAARLAEFTPTAGVAVPLLAGRRWLAVLGAVGQPRDRNPAASYALLDETQAMLTYIRVPYDVAAAARKIREAGLPPVLAARLEQGY
jgi:diadenosine tetraphosphatase ApaH/serine/threonine PP2A family protein phosphatase